jgi:alpha-glucosidase (family GH31 glycosyl hydrolase)
MATADRKTVHWPDDSTYVDVTREDAVDFWSKRFRVSPGKLKQAVRTVGARFKDVDHHLKDNR